MRRLLALLLATTSCAALRGSERGNMVAPPKQDRCAAQPADQRRECEVAFGDAVRYASKLFTDDQLCIDGEHQLQDDSRACRIRAFVEGTAPNAVELEIRDAPADSKYKIDSDWWFDHKALADLQCRALGYGLPSDEPIR